MRPPPSPLDLLHLARVLSDAVTGSGTGFVVGVEPAGDAIDLFFRPPPEGQDCVDCLLGFAAPPGWAALGVAAPALAQELDGRADRSGTSTDVVVVHLLGRDGESLWTMGVPGGPVETMAGPAVGRVVDACRRALALPTAPPIESPLGYWAARWLLNVLSRAEADAVPATWADVAACFPGGGPFHPLDAGRPRALEDHGRLLALTCPWPAFREACAAGMLELPDMTADLAAWMDDGMFSRWLTGGLPPLDLLVADLGTLLAEQLHRRVRSLLRAWDLWSPRRSRR